MKIKSETDNEEIYRVLVILNYFLVLIATVEKMFALTPSNYSPFVFCNCRVSQEFKEDLEIQVNVEYLEEG